MDEIYQPDIIEHKAQQYWREYQSFKVTEDLSKEKFYCLTMFPYPSGRLHMGHARNYTIGDIVARYQRMQGKNVLQPMGWDAFGLPAENAAIKQHVAPAKWTYDNIDHMREQMKSLGFAYDWKREITTCKPEYYRWEQWLFIKMYEKGLAYKKSAIVNWDPVDMTVLANEQVVDGKGWRSGAVVERREIPQWFFKISAYADELLDGLEQLEQWPEQVKTMQRNWIGRSEGVLINFKVNEIHEPISVFTTRADTLYGVTYLAIAPTHSLALKAAQSNAKLKTFIEQCQHIQVAEAAVATVEKKGVATNLTATHPLTGEQIPIWVANFVVIEYGTGAVMAVPAHDERDFEFAKSYNLPLKKVIKPIDGSSWDYNEHAFVEYGVLMNSGRFDGQTSEDAIQSIIQSLQEKKLAKPQINYRLRDWGVSRQRYWGTPIPIINCKSCGTVPVPLADLPVLLPENVKFEGYSSPLKDMDEFYKTTCPNCHEEAFRETDTLDTFVESSWYYTRFACVNQDKAMLDDRAKYWTPVDHYVGGVEHAVMHLLYARFIHKILRDLGLVNSNEPFTCLLTQGMVLKDGVKMSKSKGNVVEPLPLIQKYGADTVRLFMAFAAPPEQSLEWSDSGIEGAYRFLKRVWSFAYQYEEIIKPLNQVDKDSLESSTEWQQAPKVLIEARRDMYTVLRQARYDYNRQQFNTVVSGSMKLLNLVHMMSEISFDDPSHDELRKRLILKSYGVLLRLLAPIAPHITHFLWRQLAYGDDILNAKWPKVNPDALKTDFIKLVVQVNGKLRGKISIPEKSVESDIELAAVNEPNVKRFIANKKIKKVVVVPGKLVNVVI